jgi:AraC-like DNA-binding protein
MATPMINKSILLHVVRLLDGVASPTVTDRALQAAGLERRALIGAPGFLPLSAEVILAEAVARATGERHIGTVVGEKFRYRALGWYAGYVLSAPRLGGALARGRRGLSLLHPGCKVTLRDARTHVVLGIDTRLRHVNGARHLDEAMPFLLLDLARQYLGEGWSPDWLEATTTRPQDGPVLEERFSAKVRTGMDLPGIALRKTDLAARNPDPPHASTRVGLSDLPRLMGLTPPRTVAEEVLVVLQSQLVLGDLSADATARRLAKGVRSLQRSLQAEGTSFREVQQRFLKERATALLSETDLSAGEIARLLGYDGPDSFRRAFVKWTGVPPSKFAASSRPEFNGGASSGHVGA